MKGRYTGGVSLQEDQVTDLQVDENGNLKAILVDEADAAVEFLPPGRAAAADSVPVAISTEDFNEFKRASAGASTSVASSATPVTLLAANTSRKKAIINNSSTQILYVLLGTGTVSSTVYTYVLAAEASSIPSRIEIENFTGAITGIWASANGNARITELT